MSFCLSSFVPSLGHALGPLTRSVAPRTFADESVFLSCLVAEASRLTTLKMDPESVLLSSPVCANGLSVPLARDAATDVFPLGLYLSPLRPACPAAMTKARKEAGIATHV